MLRSRSRQWSFIAGLLFLCLIYIGFECFFDAYSMLSVDEFWFAHRIYQYKDNLPYRDFAPYKTVIGYYLLLIPMLTAQGILGTLIFTKNALAVLNATVFFSASLWLTRYFSRAAVLVSLALLLSSEIVLSYSTNIRVDLLAYWLCFFSLLLLLEKRYFLAGILIGLGFATSQKAIWYLFASNSALGIYWLTIARDKQTIWAVWRFNLGAILMIAVYIALWSWVTNWHLVINNIFSEAAAMYQLDWYNNARHLFWSLTFIYNPLLFLLWPLALLSLLVTYQGDANYHQRVFIITYAFAILFCLFPYKQVFPYYMQVTFPIFLTLYAAFFSWLLAVLKPDATITMLVRQYYLMAFLASYLIAVIYIVSSMNLPYAYLLICIIPILLGFQFIQRRPLNVISSLFCFNIIAITVVFTGLIYPLTLFTKKVIHSDGAYQKANVEVLNELLVDGGDYLAGIDLLYNKSQPIAGMKHLMGPAIDYLYAPSSQLRVVMLSSLDEDPRVTTASVIADLKKSSVKFYVNNYRLRAVPTSIQNYLTTQYEHLWGSIYIYAPTVTAGNHVVNIKFNGYYQVESSAPVRLQRHSTNQPVIPSTNVIPSVARDLDISTRFLATPGSYIYLTKGSYTSIAPSNYRLKLIPNQTQHHLEKEFQNDDWVKLTL